tara:strand:- start:5423 stop:5755 length:333 start_codon:yes stop_codon:yes gene_type:complete
MACPPPLLESINKSIDINKNIVTVSINIETKSKKGPRIVISDLEMLDWLAAKGYNVKSVLKSGHVDNLALEGNVTEWQFDISKFPPSPPRPKPIRRKTREVKPKVKTPNK